MNVVLIMTDQQKATSLPMYGNPSVRTPNLSRLSDKGILFTNAFTSCPLCVPARVSLFTGQYPSVHGSLNNNMLMAPGKEHLLKILKAAGYTTGLAGKNHCFCAEDLNFFDFVAQCGHYGPFEIIETGGYSESTEFLRNAQALKGAWGHVKNPFPAKTLGTAWVTEGAIEFVRRNAEKPFFLWYSIPDPHIPFQTSEPFSSMYPPREVELPVWRSNEMEGKPRSQQIDYDVLRGADVEENTVREIISLYYGMNSFIDSELGRFFDFLDSSGLSGETMIVYVSDHGEYLGEHRMIRKSKAAYDCLTRIPFILDIPGMGGSTVDAFVSLEDIMPTILSVLDLPIPDTVNGRDLLPLFDGGEFDDTGYAYGEYGVHGLPVPENTEYPRCATPLSPDFRPAMKLGGYGKMRFIRTQRWKLAVYAGDLDELYDLDSDPYELENIHGRAGTGEITAKLTKMMIERMMLINSPGTFPTSVS